MSQRDEPAVDLAAVLDAAETALVAMDRHGVIAYANRRARQMLGRDEPDIVGVPFDDVQWELRDPDGRPRPADEYPVSRALAGETVVDDEVLVRVPGHGTTALLASARPVTGPDGEVELVVTTSIDVTPAARLRDDLEANRTRLAAIFDHASEGIVLADDERRYVAVNPAAAKLLGTTVDELVGTSIDDVYVGAVDPATTSDGLGGAGGDLDAIFDDFVSDGTLEQLTVLRRTDGREVIVENTSVANVEPGLHLSVWRDVTDRHRMLDDLARSQRRLATVVDGSPDGLLLCSPDGRVVLTNPAVPALLGVDRVHDRHIDEVLAEAGTGADVLRPTGPDDDRTGRLATLPDRTVVEFRVTEIPESGEVVVTLEDVTKRERAEDALRRALERERSAAEELAALNRLKDTFMSAVSHELRTPLTAIGGLSATLVAHDADLDEPRRHDIVRRVRANAVRLEELLDDLMDLNRIQRGAAMVNRGPVRLRRMLEAVVRPIEPGQHHVVVEADEVEVEADRAKLERIVENLLVNGLRHTPPGTTVTVRAGVAGDDLVIEVEDDGPGFPTDLGDGAFEMFVKGESGIARSTGTGVGLALVKEFAEVLGGQAVIVGDSPGGHVRVTVPTSDPTS